MVQSKNITNTVPNLILSGEDNKAIVLLYKYTFPKIKTYIKSNSGNRQDAEDIFQETIVIFYKYMKDDKFNSNQDVDAIVFTIARNLWINHAKRRSKINYKEEIETNEVEPAWIEQNMMDHERKELIYETFGQLGSKCKEILIQVIYHQNSMKDLAEKLGFSSEDSAKTQHYKCKQKLMDLVGDSHRFKMLLQNEI